MKFAFYSRFKFKIVVIIVWKLAAGKIFYMAKESRLVKIVSTYNKGQI